jgi:hypothetical protein
MKIINHTFSIILCCYFNNHEISFFDSVVSTRRLGGMKKVSGTFSGFHVVFKSYFCTFSSCLVCFVALWKTCNCFSKQFMSFSQQLNFSLSPSLPLASATDNYGRVSKRFFKAIFRQMKIC